MFTGKSGITQGNTTGPAADSLAVGAVNDPLETEADAVADTVMRMPAPAIQRKCAHCEEEEKVQRKPQTAFVQRKEDGGSAGPAITSGIQATKGGGNPLPDNTRTFMESRFGADFSAVRIHTGSYAADLSTGLQAQAFTVGNDIYFNNGRFAPESGSGQHLLAHELTHTLQQQGDNTLRNKLIQREFAVEPTVAAPAVRDLTATEISAAIRRNSISFREADEIGLLRDVLGIAAAPAAIDEDFVRAVGRYQASYGLTQDGMIGSDTALHLANELGGEATTLGADADVGHPAAEMALNPAERRMRLRSRVANRLGTMLRQEFVGPRDAPTGIVTVRSGVDYQTLCGSANDCRNGIQLDYTGSNADNAHWLQFISLRMSAADPASGTEVFPTGNTTLAGQNLPYSNATDTHWIVDSNSATDPFYEAGYTTERTAGRNTSLLDQPQRWNGIADAFAASSFATRPATVRAVLGFDTHLIVNNRSTYHIRWSITFNYNTSVTPTADVAGSYRVISSGATTALPAALRTALRARYTASPIR